MEMKGHHLPRIPQGIGEAKRHNKIFKVPKGSIENSLPLIPLQNPDRSSWCSHSAEVQSKALSLRRHIVLDLPVLKVCGCCSKVSEHWRRKPQHFPSSPSSVSTGGSLGQNNGGKKHGAGASSFSAFSPSNSNYGPSVQVGLKLHCPLVDLEWLDSWEDLQWSLAHLGDKQS